ncbi:TRAP transporter small permease subunit [Litorivicinus lipolyticus]|jgi:TRAP-type transport system small permease protein|uniref:TRAP transporter small permease protein n=1 Tax=Litorivicinus lipolyticus TaxID=418701 RepID=A0A5Q2Q683_9GAMM|nr:TRAP transporter small permease [Litorivicinus lipolyticus]QGG79258.1 TRAP transporter small permease subunit [Litorivicinus lipolyticus]
MLWIDAPLKALNHLNNAFGRLGLNIAWVLVSLMVGTILLQVFMRYVVNHALPWPEEVARALMIWMMALVAAPALRKGDFVAITLLPDSLPVRLGQLLNLVLMLFCCAILFLLSDLSIDFFQRGFRTRAASFNLPRAWIYLAMGVCYFSMLAVMLELTLRHLRLTLTGKTPC